MRGVCEETPRPFTGRASPRGGAARLEDVVRGDDGRRCRWVILPAREQPRVRRAGERGARGGEGGEDEEERGGHEPADLVAQPKAIGQPREGEAAEDDHAEGKKDAQRGRQVDEQPVARLARLVLGGRFDGSGGARRGGERQHHGGGCRRGAQDESNPKVGQEGRARVLCCGQEVHRRLPGAVATHPDARFARGSRDDARARKVQPRRERRERAAERCGDAARRAGVPLGGRRTGGHVDEDQDRGDE
mmetsp:Transcript_5456/g.17766  ORF Transcript_5456/g.17766 Transcript_5456/m.17766 type:complete len:247 (+) Transcript_5456:722-1462(+)